MTLLMKLLITSFLLLIFSTAIYAQQNEIDRERLNRDIRIMESALEELFRLDNGNGVHFSMPGFSLGSRTGAGHINGRYLPGYGIIFSVPDISRRAIGIFSGSAVNNLRLKNESDNLAIAFSTNPIESESNKGEEKITEDEIKASITEFFVNYAPSIRQLNDNDKVMVLYGAEATRRGFATHQPAKRPVGDRPSGQVILNKNHEQDSGNNFELPVISMAVSVSDMKALRNGRISESSFIDRIETVTTKRNADNRHRDLEIFANILETGLKETGDELFRINRKPAHVYLEDFGVIYQLDLSRPAGLFLGDWNRNFNFQIPESDFTDAMGSIQFNINKDDFRFDIDSLRVHIGSDFFTEEDREKLRKELEEARKRVEEARKELEERLPELRERQEEARKKIEEQQLKLREQFEKQRERARDPEAIRESLENQIHTLKELMVDYGQTLSTLKNDHSLLITINLRTPRGTELPNRIDLRISKSDLERKQRGSISRDQALERVVVTPLD